MAITVNHPNSNESLLKGSSFFIEWSDSSGSSWDIDLYKDGILIKNIVTAHTGALIYEWSPPTALMCGTDYTLKITNNLSTEGDSGEFTIYAYYNLFVYQLNKDEWTKFTEIDIVETAILSGGGIVDNLNLLLTNQNNVNKYPGDNTTSIDSVLVSRRYDIQKGILRKLWLDIVGSAEIKTRMYNEDFASPYYKDNSISSYLKRTWRGIANGYNRGDAFELHITNADTVKSIVVDLDIIGRGKEG